MTNNRFFKQCLVLALVMVAGLGLAVGIPFLAGTQGMAAQDEFGEQDNSPQAPKRYYVAITGTGSPGTSWEDAFTNLQDALAVAADPSEIWVAKGIYYPDVGSGQIENALTSTFAMTDGVALYGGFEFGDENFSDRDPNNNITVLSGDIRQDDDTDSNGVVISADGLNDNNNAYHVVTAVGVTGTAELDGFTITAGEAVGSYDEYGGGFFCDGKESGNYCNPKLSNIIFRGNFAKEYGGGMYNDGMDGGSSNPCLSNVTFSDNTSGYRGGAMFNCSDDGGHSKPILTNVTFTDNHAENDGGAIFNNGEGEGDSSPHLTNVIFSGNSANSFGGAIYNDSDHSGQSSPILTNVVFSGNYADAWAGAMFNECENKGISKPVMNNVTFSGNTAGQKGGAIHSYRFGDTGTCIPEMRNSILWNNKDSSGTGTISATIYNNNSTISLTHSIVQGTGGSGSGTWPPSYLDGLGNTDEDPLFITSVDPATAPTDDGDLRLTMNSPAIDTGDDQYITEIVDLDNNPREVDGNGDGEAIVDMGAYEYQPKHQLSVSKTGFGDGTVTSTPSGIDCGDMCSLILKEGSTITLTALPDDDSIFTGWSGDCSGSWDCVLVMDEDKNVTATFKAPEKVNLPVIMR